MRRRGGGVRRTRGETKRGTGKVDQDRGESTEFWARWRAECPLNAGVTYLNSGTLGPALQVVTETVERLRREWMAAGPGASVGVAGANGYFEMMAAQDRARKVLADWLKTDARSVALTGNATDGINFALTSVRWHAGDRILTTADEHGALLFPLERLKALYGVAVDTATFPTAGREADWVRSVQRLLTPRTRLLALSSVSHQSGVAIDLARILDGLVRPALWVLVDGSHAAGTRWPLLVPGVDFYVFPGHKWLFGPAGSGVLWVSPRALAELDGPQAGAPMIRAEDGRPFGRDGAWRYEYGTRDWSVTVGLAAAITFRQQWDEATIMRRYQEVGEAFGEGFGQAGGAELTGSGPLWHVAVGDPGRAARHVWEHARMIVKPDGSGIRVSLPPWLTPAEGIAAGRTLARYAR